MDYIIGMDNRYKINRKGEIWSCYYKKIMTPLLTEDGYLYLHLKNNTGRKKCFISRLIALQYIPNPNNLPECDHIDRDKTNNNVENLRWVTRVENRRNQTRYETSRLRTEEGKEERKKELREYKRLLAKQDRLSKGITPKK